MSPAIRKERATRASRSAAERPTPRRGRPPRLSRERVVAAVLRLIDRAPGEAVTIARVADEVGASPAALYRHFENLDDLLDAVVASVLAEVGASLDAGDSWERQLEEWMQGLRARLLRVPAVLALIGRTGRTSPAWLDAASVLLEILEGAGLAGDALAVTYLWVLETTTGLVLQEAALPVSEQLANARASKPAWSAAAAARFAAVSPALDAVDGDRLFSFAVAQAISVVNLQRSESVRG